MDTKDMQKAVDDWFKEIGAEYWDPQSMGLKMAEETGELSRAINNEHGGRPSKGGEKDGIEPIKEELGDILFTACCIANKLGFTLEEAFEIIMKKYNIRDRNRYSKSEDKA